MALGAQGLGYKDVIHNNIGSSQTVLNINQNVT